MVDIEYLLDLARMEIDSSEKSAFSEDLSKMIEYMNSIQNVSEDTLETEIVAPRLRDDEPCNGTVAVSYTHLDVYKRQDVRSGNFL